MNWSDIKSKIKRNVHNKHKAIILISIILIQCFALLTITGIVRPAFAQADIYSVSNTIYMNVTEPWTYTSSEDGISPIYQYKTISVTVTDDGKIYTDGHQVQLCSDEGGLAFTPDAQQAAMGIITGQQALNPGVLTIDIGGQVIGVSPNAERYVGSILNNGSWVVKNTADHIYGIVGLTDPLSAPVIRKSVLFDSSQNTAESFCSENGYTLINIINSTFDETINTDLMNFYQTKPAEHDMYIIGSSSLNSSSMEIQPFVVTTGLIIAIVAIAAAVVVICVLGGMGIAAYTITTLNLQNDLTFLADQSMGYQADIANNAVDNLQEWEQYCLSLYANKTITFDELQAMLSIGGAPFLNIANNATTNINNLGVNALDDLSDLSTPYGFAFSWTDVWFWIIVAIIAIFVIYIIYVAIKRWGNKQEIQVRTIGGVI